MKTFAMSALAAVVCLSLQPTIQAQYKAPSQYLSKSKKTSPAGTNVPANQQQPKFKDLQPNTGFYFLSDTNRTYLWTKTSATQAKNNKNGVVQTINGQTPVQK